MAMYLLVEFMDDHSSGFPRQEIKCFAISIYSFFSSWRYCCRKTFPKLSVHILWGCKVLSVGLKCFIALCDIHKCLVLKKTLYKEIKPYTAIRHIFRLQSDTEKGKQRVEFQQEGQKFSHRYQHVMSYLVLSLQSGKQAVSCSSGKFKICFQMFMQLFF